MLTISSRPFILALAGIALAATATAADFSVSGPGGPIPDPGTTPGIWNITYFGAPFVSSVTVDNPVTSITAIRLNGLQHPWRGDLHIFLRAPSSTCSSFGPSCNIVVRPGFTGGTSAGDSGDYLSGNYTIVTSGGGSVAQGASDISGGTYNQYLNTGVGMWTNGIANIPLNTISAPPGPWTLEIRDWGRHGGGSLTGWTLEGTDSGSPISSSCGAGDGSLTQSCQGATGAPGHGCGNSSTSAGAWLTATGSPACDTLVLTQSGQTSNTIAVFMQSSTYIPAGAQFGDGVGCIGGSMLRLYIKTAVGGVVTAPQAGDPSIRARSAALGDVIPAGSVRYYQVLYRDPGSVTGLNFNVGNALRVQY